MSTTGGQMPSACGIALGSNLGQRCDLLRTALDALLALPDCCELSGQASLYESDPVDCPPGSPRFVNTVIELRWKSSPEAILDAALMIEKQLGRQRSVRNAPRPIDIDLLYFGNKSIDTPSLQIPHPRLHQRRFVLQPLAEIRPDLVLPGHHKSIEAHLASLDSQEAPLNLLQSKW